MWSAETCNAIRPPPAPYLDALAAAYAEAAASPMQSQPRKKLWQRPKRGTRAISLEPLPAG